MTLRCVIILTNPDNTITVRDNVWSRNISGMVTVVNTVIPIPNHTQVFNSTTGVFSDLVITNVTLEDNNAEYICTSTGSISTSSVVLNVTGNNVHVNIYVGSTNVSKNLIMYFITKEAL